LIFVVGAQELAVCLTDELKLHKPSSWSQLPKLHGFQLISTSGPSVVLTRKYYNETYEKLLRLIVVLIADISGLAVKHIHSLQWH